MAAPRPVPRAGLSLRHSRCRREGTALRSSSPASLLRLCLLRRVGGVRREPAMVSISKARLHRRGRRSKGEAGGGGSYHEGTGLVRTCSSSSSSFSFAPCRWAGREGICMGGFSIRGTASRRRPRAGRTRSLAASSAFLALPHPPPLLLLPIF